MTSEARKEGFCWVVLGRNPPEIASWERGEWRLAGNPKPWHPEAVTVVSDRLVFTPRLKPGADRMIFHIRPFPDDEWPDWSPRLGMRHSLCMRSRSSPSSPRWQLSFGW